MNGYAAELAPDGRPVTIISLACEGLRLQLMDWGATWLSCQVPLAGGRTREVLLGCASVADWFEQQSFLNATVGRYANRIAHSRIARPASEGGDIRLLPFPENGPHQLHGGPDGFHLRRWAVLDQSPSHVRLGMHSAAGDQGFPGNLETVVSFSVEPGLRIRMQVEGRSDAATPFVITQHAYLNLDGASDTVCAHRLQIAAARFTPVDAQMIPLGHLAPVAGTCFDFRQPRVIGGYLADEPQQQSPKGYDHAFLLDSPGLTQPAAQLGSAQGDLRLDFFTEAPALQLYTAQHLGPSPARQGGVLGPWRGVCLEPGYLPDSPNHPEWPQASCWLHPGETARQTSVWAFHPAS